MSAGPKIFTLNIRSNLLSDPEMKKYSDVNLCKNHMLHQLRSAPPINYGLFYHIPVHTTLLVYNNFNRISTMLEAQFSYSFMHASSIHRVKRETNNWSRFSVKNIQQYIVNVRVTYTQGQHHITFSEYGII